MNTDAANGTPSREDIHGGCWRVAVLALALLLTASPAVTYADAPLNYFLHAAGPAATPTMRLGWALAALVTVVALIVVVLLIGAIARRRSSTERDERHVHAEGGGMHWV